MSSYVGVPRFPLCSGCNMDFWQAISQHDPKTADPHFCWALLQLEAERYVTIKGGKVTPTEKCKTISSQVILDSEATVAQCDCAKEMPCMEAEGLVTIHNGMVAFAALGKERAIDTVLDEKGYPKASEPEVDG